MNHVQTELKPPERRVCRVLDHPRSTQRDTAVPRDGDEHLVRRLHEMVQQLPTQRLSVARRSAPITWPEVDGLSRSCRPPCFRAAESLLSHVCLNSA